MNRVWTIALVLGVAGMLAACQTTAKLGVKLAQLKAHISRDLSTLAGNAKSIKLTPKKSPQMAVKVAIPADGNVKVMLPKTGDQYTAELLDDNDQSQGAIDFPAGSGMGETDQIPITDEDPMVKGDLVGNELTIDLGEISDDPDGSGFDCGNNPLEQVDSDADGTSDYSDFDDDGDGTMDTSDETFDI